MLNAQFSRLARTLGNPKRIELLDLLAQAERSVEELAGASGMDFANTSAQLQVLSRAHLVEARREGRRVIYRLADGAVTSFLAALPELAPDRLAEVEQGARDYFDARGDLGPLTSTELMRRLDDPRTG